MALKFADFVQDTTQSTGTGSLTLDNVPPTGRRGFSVLSDQDLCKFAVSDAAGNWEVAVGRYTAAGDGLLSRDRVIASSQNGAAVAFSGGVKDVVLVATSEEYAMAATYFRAGDGTTQSDETGDGTDYAVKFGAQEKDVGENYDPATHLYTAPFTGDYNLKASVQVNGLASGHTHLEATFLVAGSPQSVLINANPYASRSLVGDENFTFTIHAEYTLTAGQTVGAQVRVTGGAKAVDVRGRRFSGWAVSV